MLPPRHPREGDSLAKIQFVTEELYSGTVFQNILIIVNHVVLER